MAQPWERYLIEREEQHLAELLELLRIPSVSALPAHRVDVARAAAWVATRLRAAGVPEVEVLPTADHPLVWGRWRVDDRRPTALIYAHFDVQPPDPLDRWESPPFAPTVRDGRIYARGAADDKAGLMIAVTAVEALARTGGAPPLNLVFFLEGEEEVGSPSLPEFVRAERRRLACDVVVSADGVMEGPDRPALTVAAKGLVGCRIALRTGETDLHSGAGAAVPNAVQAMAQLLASFHAPDGRITVAGFSDRVREPTAEDRAEIAATAFDEATYLAGTRANALWGEPGYSAAERLAARPTLDLHGMWGGFRGEGLKTVTPCEAHATLTCRLVPDQEPDEVLALIERHVARHRPPGAVATVEPLPGAGRPFAIRRDHPALRTAGGVLRELYGKEPLLVRQGFTLPVATLFQRELGADTVFFAWSMPGCDAHAPNEWFRLADFRLARRAWCAYLTALAG